MSPGWDGTGWDGGSLPLPGGVPYLARRGWRVMSSVHQRCWWPRTRTCPGRSPRCSLSAGHLWGQGWDLSHDGQHRMGTGLTSIPTTTSILPTKMAPRAQHHRVPLPGAWEEAEATPASCGPTGHPRLAGGGSEPRPSPDPRAAASQWRLTVTG